MPRGVRHAHRPRCMLDQEPRILFALAEPGYFRMYGPAITEMTRRGWKVGVAFEKPDRRGTSPSIPPTCGAPIEMLGRPPIEISSAATTLRLGIDYIRYLEPAFADAHYLRRRVERYLPASLAFLTRVPRLSRGAVSTLVAASRLGERVIAPSRPVVDFVAAFRPDVLFVSPLLALGPPGVHQTELVKAARALRMPAIVGIGSWDHLTSKGLIRVVPDAVLVWNETQCDEAVRLHRVPRARVTVTGAQAFDHWFEPVSPDAVRSFRRGLDLNEGRVVLLVVGSSPKMAPGDSEVLFVRRWLAAIRAAASPALRNAFIIFRPHPGNTAPWIDVDLADAGAVVHPRTYRHFPLTESDIEQFRCSLAVSTAVIGVNTTAMIEAAILRKPVLTVRDDAFTHSQQQTLHFAYLEQESGGFALSADTLREHVAQLEHLIAEGADLSHGDRFVERFVRPFGIHRSATVQVCDAIERTASTRRRTIRPTVHETPLSQLTR